jgi:hypothetical protein
VPEYDPIMLEKCIMKKHCVDPGVDAETIAIHG